MKFTKEEKEKMRKRFGEIIESKRLEKGLSLRKLGQKMDLAYQTISLYERGINLPTKFNLKKLIEILDIDVESIKEEDGELYDYIQDQMNKLEIDQKRAQKYLETDEDYKNLLMKAFELFESISKSHSQTSLNDYYSLNSWIDIPVFSSITSGDLEQNQEVIGKTRIPSEWLYGEHTYFGLKVNDDRNIPYFIEGDILIAQQIDDKYTLGNDEFVIFNINGSNARVGRYHTTGNQVSISFVNESYKPQEISVFDTLKIIGVVKELRRRVV